MSNTNNIQNYFDSQLAPLFNVVEEVLNDWTGDKCYQLPVLLMNIATRMNWDTDGKQLRAKDSIIRDYIRNHPDWDITRGAHGGVVRRSAKLNKEAAAKAKRESIEAAKKEIMATIDSNVAATASNDNSSDNDSDDDDITEV